MLYNAFISYPHKTGWRLAKKLQEALQTLAKPWNKSKALNIFRDESNLTSTPHLWNDIFEALKNSEHFILLASVNTVGSKWVNDEIDYWIKNRNLERMHIVFIDGQLNFSHGSKLIDWENTNCLPIKLKEVFKEIPLYTDLTSFRDAIDVSLNNEEFKNQIIPLAASLHNKTPEELVSEHVKAFKKARFIRNSLYTLSAALIMFVVYLFVKLANTNSTLLETNNKLSTSYIKLENTNDSLKNAKTIIINKDSILIKQVNELNELVAALDKRQKELVQSNNEKNNQLQFAKAMLQSYNNDLIKWSKNQINNIDLPLGYKSDLPSAIIFFDYDRFNLRPDAISTNDKVISILKNNPTAQLTLKSKESWGYSKAYAVSLSSKRASSISRYLIAKGIDRKRLKPLPMGDNEITINLKNTDPEIQTIINSINSCCEFYISNPKEQ